MKRLSIAILITGMLLGSSSVLAHEEHHHHDAQAAAPANEQVLTGEVVDVVCYLSHPDQGLGAAHADCAKKCISQGLPVAIRVGDQLYLAAMADHQPANKALAKLAGRHVTVHGNILERDGQHVIEISKIEEK